MNIGLNNDNEVSFAFKGGSILTGAIGDAAGSRTRTGFGGKCESTSATEGVSGFYLDSPNTTSATTYDCRLSHGMNGGNGTMYLNRSHSDTDDQHSEICFYYHSCGSSSMTNPLDDLLKRYEQELIAIQNRKAQAKRSYELECQNEHRYQGAIIGVKDAQAQLLSTKAQEEQLKPSDAQKSS